MIDSLYYRASAICFSLIFQDRSDQTDQINLSLVMRKPVFGVSDLIQHKPGCAVTEDGQRLEISDLKSRGIVVSV